MNAPALPAIVGRMRESRESELRRRMSSLGITPTELARDAGVDRSTVTRALDPANKAVRDTTYSVLFGTLDRIEHETSADVPDAPAIDPAASLIEFEVSGDFGVHVIVRGPVGDAEALERSAARLIREIREIKPEKP